MFITGPAKDETYGVTINWCDWSEVGMTVNVIKQDFVGREEKIDYDSMIRHSVNPKEGVEVFNRIMEQFSAAGARIQLQPGT